jgi:ABC-type antimicrobial peptide transport system permease subunit
MAAALLATAICTGILSGLYPALVLSSFKPAQVIKGAAANTGQKSLFRNILVVFQFAVSVVLLVCTLVISGQLQFIRSHNIGFNKQNLLYAALPMMNDTVDHAGLLKTILSKYPATANYTVVDHLPTDLSTGGDVSWSGKNPNQQAIFPGLDADQNFIKTFGMNMVAGRFFLENNQADRHNYVINEEALKTMNRTADQMLGQQIKVNGREGNVIGIVKNFNFKSVQHAIEPLIITDVNRARFLVIRTNESDTKSAIISLMSTFKQAYQNYPLTYGFVDQDIERLYDNDQQMGRIFNVFSIISIIISCLGLFGLATFTAIKRQKEVGVRRVLGATISRIVVMLSFDFIKLIIVSLLIAFPLSWWLMNSWLSGFAYRNGINCWIFIASGGAAIIIALLTISYQSITTALQNPVKSLKNE